MDGFIYRILGRGSRSRQLLLGRQFRQQVQFDVKVKKKTSKINKVIKNAFIEIIKIIGKTLAAAIITSPITYLSVKEAYATRGYFAVGGEWILMIALVVTVLWMTDRKRDSRDGQ